MLEGRKVSCSDCMFYACRWSGCRHEVDDVYIQGVHCVQWLDICSLSSKLKGFDLRTG